MKIQTTSSVGSTNRSALTFPHHAVIDFFFFNIENSIYSF